MGYLAAVTEPIKTREGLQSYAPSSRPQNTSIHSKSSLIQTSKLVRNSIIPEFGEPHQDWSAEITLNFIEHLPLSLHPPQPTRNSPSHGQLSRMQSTQPTAWSVTRDPNLDGQGAGNTLRLNDFYLISLVSLNLPHTYITVYVPAV